MKTPARQKRRNLPAGSAGSSDSTSGRKSPSATGPRWRREMSGDLRECRRADTPDDMADTVSPNSMIGREMSCILDLIMLVLCKGTRFKHDNLPLQISDKEPAFLWLFNLLKFLLFRASTKQTCKPEQGIKNPLEPSRLCLGGLSTCQIVALDSKSTRTSSCCTLSRLH